jgi:hypothetical protein
MTVAAESGAGLLAAVFMLDLLESWDLLPRWTEGLAPSFGLPFFQ